MMWKNGLNKIETFDHFIISLPFVLISLAFSRVIIEYVFWPLKPLITRLSATKISTKIDSDISLVLEGMTQISTSSENSDFKALIVQAKIFFKAQCPLPVSQYLYHWLIFLYCGLFFPALLIYLSLTASVTDFRILLANSILGVMILIFPALLIQKIVIGILRTLYTVSQKTRKQLIFNTVREIIKLESKIQDFASKYSSGASIGEYLEDLEDITQKIDTVSKFQSQISIFKNPSFIERYTCPPNDISLVSEHFDTWFKSLHVSVSMILKKNLENMNAEIAQYSSLVQNMETPQTEFEGAKRAQLDRLSILERDIERSYAQIQ